MVVLITGASSGFGQLLAARLAANGHTVFGTSRDPAAAGSDRPLLPLDVRDDASVSACLQHVEREAGRVDVLVNNAGYLHEGPLEEMPMEDLKAVFETNFFGTVRVTAAVLPGMRARRQGRIINVSSLAGLIALPFMGAYCASKHALESYSESLRQELRPFGISVSLVEPGYYKTSIAARKLRTTPAIADYDAQRTRMYAAFAHGEERAPGPEAVVSLLTRLVEGAPSGLRHVIGHDARTYHLRGVIPQWAWEWGMRRNFGLD